jgi:1,4-dihydroxy-2-naphthoate octaprenyltransferase
MNTVQIWIGAARPKILPASMTPAVLGSALAYYDGLLQPLPAIVALLCAMLLQTISNLYNDVYDFKRGADTPDRVGPKRFVASGLIAPDTMMRVTGILAACTFLLGLYLVYVGGWVILLIGLLSLLFAWAYTGGPYPIAYLGLGDVFVLLFFGLIPTIGTYFIQVQEINVPVIITSLIPGFFAANILAVNNIRDIETDKPAGKITIAVRLGLQRSRILFACIYVISYVLILWLAFTLSWWLALAFLSVPLAVKVIRDVYSNTGSVLNRSLADSSKLLALVGILLALGFIVG